MGFFYCTEGKDCVVISEEGQGVEYKSGRDEVNHSNSLTVGINIGLIAFWWLLLLLCNQDTKSFCFDRVVTADNIQVQMSCVIAPFEMCSAKLLCSLQSAKAQVGNSRSDNKPAESPAWAAAASCGVHVLWLQRCSADMWRLHREHQRSDRSQCHQTGGAWDKSSLCICWLNFFMFSHTESYSGSS